MTAAREREIVAMIHAEGLQASELRVNGSGHYAVEVTAPTGARRPFVFSRSPGDKRRANYKARSLLRRFAREEQVPDPQLTLTDIAAAVLPQPLAAVLTPPPVAEPAPPVSPPPPAIMTAPKTTIVRNQLSATEMFRLCDWTKNADLSGCHTYPELARRAADGLSMAVTDANARTALKAVGRELPPDPARRPKAATANERILARALVALMGELGRDPGEDLRSLAA